MNKYFSMSLIFLIALVACSPAASQISQVPTTTVKIETGTPRLTLTQAPPNQESTAQNNSGFSCPGDDCSKTCLTRIPALPSSATNINLRGHSHINLSENEESILLVSYTIKNDRITDPEFEEVPAWLSAYQKDSTSHQILLDFFLHLIPATYHSYLNHFRVITDGVDEILASMYQSEDAIDKWTIEVDFMDTKDTADLAATAIHEFAHLLSLNPSQVPPSSLVFDNPDNDQIYDQEVNACATYFPGEGCSESDSYINLFYHRFWLAIEPQWRKINELDETSDEYYDELDNFYQSHKDQFVSDYAPTDPSEDFAETFNYFVLYPKPKGVTIAETKVLFFYQFPELVMLRSQIDQSLCNFTNLQ